MTKLDVATKVSFLLIKNIVIHIKCRKTTLLKSEQFVQSP